MVTATGSNSLFKLFTEIQKRKKKKKKLAVSDVQLQSGHDEPRDEQVEKLAQGMLHETNYVSAL